MRLIDADALKHEIARVMPSRTEVSLVVDVMPDAIVRCKDCEYYEEMGHFCKYDGLYKKNSWHQFGYACYDDWFCADGVKRDDG